MRVSKLFWVNGPEPAPMKLLSTVPVCGAGNAARIFAAAGEILPIGIRLFGECRSAGAGIADRRSWDRKPARHR